jgi:hypothetical protein
MLETRRGELPNVLPPAMPITPLPLAPQGSGLTAMPGTPVPPGLPAMPGSPGPNDRAAARGGHAGLAPSPIPLSPGLTPPIGAPVFTPMSPAPTPQSPHYPAAALAPGNPLGHAGLPGTYPVRHPQAPRGSGKLWWWVIVLLAIGASAGTLAGLWLSK